MSVVNFGIVGCGSVSKVHAESIRHVSGANLVAVMSRSEESAKRLAREYECDYYTDLESLLKRSDLDAVVVLTPNALHADIGIEAARKGKHVVVEKPIDISLEKADKLIDECEKYGVKLSVIFQRRFSDAAQRVKSLIENGDFGRINFASALVKWYRSQGYYDSSDWKGTWKMEGGGALINQSIHYLDLLLYFAGPIDEVFAYMGTKTHDIEVEDVLVGVMKFKSGALGSIEANTAAYPGFEARVDIYGNAASAIIVDDKLNRLVVEEEIDVGSKGYSSGFAGASSPEISFELHKRQYEDIVDSILSDRKPAVDGVEGRNTLAVVLALYESARTKRIKKPDFRD